MLIYRFFPDGAKNINNLWPMRSLESTDLCVRPIVICHDQEPLDFARYQSRTDEIKELRKKKFSPMLDAVLPDLNLATESWANFYRKRILIHSEKNSDQVRKYQDTGLFEPCFCWSHALIARDWYRYAEFDPMLKLEKNPKKIFNIYCRAWTGSRQYRLNFLDELAQTNFVDRCSVKFSEINDGVHYSTQNTIPYLHEIFETNQARGASSAEYDAEDYLQTHIDLVLETLADDRIHLTEKILRPIACRQPFMLLSGPGSLKFLRSYGFLTYGDYIDESYDKETDQKKRRQLLISSMKQASEIKDWQPLYKIADYNAKRFFSSEFYNMIINELKINLNDAANKAFVLKSQLWLPDGIQGLMHNDDEIEISAIAGLWARVNKEKSSSSRVFV